MILKFQAQAINLKMAAHLKQLREQENYTMRTLANEMNTPHSFVGKMETQSRRLDIGEFICYCQALGKDPATELEIILAMQ